MSRMRVRYRWCQIMQIREATRILDDLLFEYKRDMYPRQHFSQEEVEALDSILEYLEQTNIGGNIKMTKNIIPEITKLLNVEIGEEFKVIDTYGNECTVRFTKNNLQVFDEIDKVWGTFACAIGHIVSGEYEIIKLPWKPKFNDKYCTFTGSDFVVRWSSWKDSAGDYTRLKCGCVFRTEEEAIKERPYIYKELIGKEWENE